jgi:hypothetical protein
MDRIEIGYENEYWMELVQDYDHWWALKFMMNILGFTETI